VAGTAGRQRDDGRADDRVGAEADLAGRTCPRGDRAYLRDFFSDDRHRFTATTGRDP
jgi:hypothetical protein